MSWQTPCARLDDLFDQGVDVGHALLIVICR